MGGCDSRAFLLMVYAEDEHLAPFFLKKNGIHELFRGIETGEML
jgi:hypothetical protein